MNGHVFQMHAEREPSEHQGSQFDRTIESLIEYTCVSLTESEGRNIVVRMLETNKPHSKPMPTAPMDPKTTSKSEYQKRRLARRVKKMDKKAIRKIKKKAFEAAKQAGTSTIATDAVDATYDSDSDSGSDWDFAMEPEPAEQHIYDCWKYKMNAQSQ